MQLDIFEHSRDVILRNAVIDALRRSDADAAARALAALRHEYAADPLLPALWQLCEKLQTPLPQPIARETAREVLEETAGALATAARAVFGRQAQAWMSPLWGELAAAIADFPFDSADESLHAAPLLLRAERWTDAAAKVVAIASWRRQPAPLAWMIEAQARNAGFAPVWPLLAELAWMAPQRAQALAPQLQLAPLDRLLRGFDTEFEGEGTAEDFKWFPTWALIADSQRAEGLRQAQDGAQTTPERCARLVVGLLTLECQGRHADLIAGRQKLRAVHPALFARYMQDR